MPWPQVQVLVWIDHNDPAFGREVLGRLSALPFASMSHYYTGEPPAAEDDRRQRRNRITDAWRWFLQEAQGPVILAAEDDTLPDADAYPRLLRHLEAGAVFAQGTEVARQFPYVPHWTVASEEILSGSYDGRPVVPIQGGGWYCAAMVTEAARGCLVAGDDLPLGPDVAFVRELAKKGPCVGDWTVECGHFTETHHYHPAMSNLLQVHYRRNGTGWQREEYEARPYRQVCQKTEDGLLKVRVLKPFTGTPEERERYADLTDRLIHAGTIMEVSEQRYAELGIRPNPLVVALSPVEGGPGSSLAGWAPVVKPASIAEKAPSEPSEDAEEPPAPPPPIRRGKKD